MRALLLLLTGHVVVGQDGFLLNQEVQQAPPPYTCGGIAEGIDCNGQDMVKINGTEADMTVAKCCELCHEEEACVVGVLATRWMVVDDITLNLCMLKSGCDDQRSTSNRVKVCTESEGDCAAPPAPAPYQCDASALPTFCDHTKPIVDRVQELVSKLTLDEKVQQVGANGAPAINRLNIPAYQWWGEALHGVCSSPSVNFRPPTPNATSFPEPGITAATFDANLWNRIGTAIGKEGRAMANAGNAGLTFWAPNINIVRDPRWGRLLETPGEDPLLTSRYAIEFVRGVQGEDANFLRASSVCKHFAAYNLDNWHGVDRFHYDAKVSAQDLADTYLQPFEACVVGANVSGLMCSYNAMNGVPTCADEELLTSLAREQWGFDGYITGDCGAADKVWTAHHFGGSAEGAAAATLAAGMDQDCGHFVKDHGTAALKQGKLLQRQLDAAVAHLFRLRIRLGYFDPPEVMIYANFTYRDVAYSKHAKMALETAEKGMVLLHNNATLPFDASKVRTVAVIGPNADNAANMQGIDCHGVPPYLITPLEGLSKFAEVFYEEGCAIKGDNESGIPAAVAAVQSADAIVIVVGLDPSLEYEMLDRTDLRLQPAQRALVSKVAAAAEGKPVVLVLMAGGVLDISEFIDSADAQAVGAAVWTGYPGQSGGEALARILFGEVNPSGRVPLTWYYNDYASDDSATAIDMLDMGMRPNETSGNPGRTYRFFPGPVLYPFGHGLSYTEFQLSGLDVREAPKLGVDWINQIVADPAPRQRYSAPTAASIAVTVQNVGRVPGEMSVLLFLVPPSSGANGNPIKSLAGFARTSALAPGEQTALSIHITAWELSLVDSDGRRGARRGSWTVLVENKSVPLRIV